MQQTDISGVLSIQQSAYPATLIESSDTFLAKLNLSPESCWLAEGAGTPLAYLFAHPWQDGHPPKLDHPLNTLPQYCSTFYLHDLALEPHARGAGIGKHLVNHALRWAREQDLKQAALVAIEGAQPFWEKLGFYPKQIVSKELLEKLADYGSGAEYLEKSLIPIENKT